ncbi:EamA family transporter [Amphibiibacter pelophylacis]|uniref:EamA family transporter n=1 Tax=Amphibiibacter pelophylacis TaxID=1799477 RepID=A0ACC6P2C3_9BURK
MTALARIFPRGVAAALASALLFGAGTPLAKLALGSSSPWLLAGLLYLGSGLGLMVFRRLSRAAPARLALQEGLWFAAAVLAGGVLAPVLLLAGLAQMPASQAALLLNAEGVFTAILAWLVFGESAGPRLVLGLLCIVAGALLLSGPGQTLSLSGVWPAVLILGACLLWALDNNLMRRVALADATWLASVKGLVAGAVNLLIWMMLGVWTGSGLDLPAWPRVGATLLIGLLAYGVSLSLFVQALRHLGTARTGAYFSAAPFAGALLGVALGEPVTPALLAAAALMALGLWLHLSENHTHGHSHEALDHAHEHTHDDGHHAHSHDGGTPHSGAGPHSHWHHHAPLTHAHAHFPDAHHRHSH